MGIGQALAIAFGLVLVVLGLTYISARGFSENPDVPQPVWWRAVRASATIGAVIFLVYVGTLVLANGAPNYFLAAGLAVFCWGEAVYAASGRQFTPSIFRLRWLAFAVMFSLFAIGGVVEGGVIGIFGAALSVIVASFWWWLVVKVPWNQR